MKIIDCVQGSATWKRARLGLPTASCFDRIVTPTGKLSTQREGYLNALLAEMAMGQPIDGPSMPWMERGNDLEPEAAAYYSFQRDVELSTVGVCVNDEGTYGASPDRLVGEEGLLELKCPSPEIHMGYLRAGKLDAKYMPQLQGQLLVTGRAWVDICAYHPLMPHAIIRVERDEKFIALLKEQLDLFAIELANGREDLRQRGLLHVEETVDSLVDPHAVTEQDVRDILAHRRRKRLLAAPVFAEFPDPMEFAGGDIIRCQDMWWTPNDDFSAWREYAKPDEVAA